MILRNMVLSINILSLRQKKRRIKKLFKNELFHFKKGTPRRLVIVVGSSYRVGSTWLLRMLRLVSRCESGIKKAPADLNRFGTLVLRPEGYDYLRKLRKRVLFKTHSLPPDSDTNARSAIFVSIYRDPRDLLVSASFFFAYLGPEKGGWGEESRQVSIQERIKWIIMGNSNLHVLANLEQWFRTPYAYKVKYEDLMARPVENLDKIASYIGIPQTPRALEEIVLKHNFETKSGREPGEAKEDHPMRKGIIGDWHNYFDQDCIDAFKTWQNGRWNRLLVEMGYEDSLDWN